MLTSIDLRGLDPDIFSQVGALFNSFPSIPIPDVGGFEGLMNTAGHAISGVAQNLPNLVGEGAHTVVVGVEEVANGVQGIDAGGLCDCCVNSVGRYKHAHHLSRSHACLGACGGLCSSIPFDAIIPFLLSIFRKCRRILYNNF